MYMVPRVRYPIRRWLYIWQGHAVLASAFGTQRKDDDDSESTNRKSSREFSSRILGRRTHASAPASDNVRRSDAGRNFASRILGRQYESYPNQEDYEEDDDFFTRNVDEATAKAKGIYDLSDVGHTDPKGKDTTGAGNGSSSEGEHHGSGSSDGTEYYGTEDPADNTPLRRQIVGVSMNASTPLSNNATTHASMPTLVVASVNSTTNGTFLIRPFVGTSFMASDVTLSTNARRAEDTRTRIPGTVDIMVCLSQLIFLPLTHCPL
jgi:hypothetical protein